MRVEHQNPFLGRRAAVNELELLLAAGQRRVPTFDRADDPALLAAIASRRVGGLAAREQSLHAALAGEVYAHCIQARTTGDLRGRAGGQAAPVQVRDALRGGAAHPTSSRAP